MVIKRLPAIVLAAALLGGAALAKPIQQWAETTRLRPSMEDKFLGVGWLTCKSRQGGYFSHAQMTVVGDRKTITGTGHGFKTWAEPGLCTFRLFLADGRQFFESPLRSITTALPRERYASRYMPKDDWGVAQLQKAVPDFVQPIRILAGSGEDVQSAEHAFIVTFVGTSSPEWLGTTKLLTRDLTLVSSESSDVHFKHNGNTLPKNSGALIYLLCRGEPLAIGIHMGGLDWQNWNVAQLFVPEHVAALPRRSQARSCRKP